MIERFTDRARRVLLLSQEEARRQSRNSIGTGHILLGLILEAEGIAAKALESLGILLPAVREVTDTATTVSSSATDRLPFDPEAGRALQKLSVEEALQFGHRFVGTEHILLALCRQEEGAAAQILVHLGADLSAVRQRVVDLLSRLGSGELPNNRYWGPTPATEIRQRVKFAEVVGQDSSVKELLDVARSLSSSQRSTASGPIIPRALLLYGPGGCGKTLLAKALAGETQAAFFSIQSSKFVDAPAGVGQATFHEVFVAAKSMAPAVVLIEELDLIRRQPDVRRGSQQIFDQLIIEIESLPESPGVVVLGETSRPDRLDPWLVCPGRFDRTVGLQRPEDDARQTILSLHLRKEMMDPALDLTAIAQSAWGLTGAELANLVNEAGLYATRAGRTIIIEADFEKALVRLLASSEDLRAS